MSTANVDLVRRLGADVVVDYKKQAFETVLHDYEVVLDALGGETLLKSLDVLKPGGKVISVAGPPAAAFARELGANPVIRLVMSALSFRTRRRARRRGVTYSFLFMKARGDQLRALTPLIDTGRIRPVVDTVFPFESAREALEFAEEEPRLVRKVILAGTGPAGGPGIDKVPALTIKATLKGALTRQDPKLSLFFNDTADGRRAGLAFLERLKERTRDRGKDISLPSFRAQLKAVGRWGRQAPSDLSAIRQPVLVANGESDRMVPSQNTLDLAARLPRSELVPLYPDAGHGGIFQHHDEFVTRALGFLET